MEREAIIRDAVASDAEAFAAIYAPFVRDTCVSFETEAPGVEEMAARIAEKSRRDFPWLTLEAGGSAAGYAYYGSWRARDAYCHTVESAIYLDPAFRGRGLGARLYAALIEKARGQGRHAMIGVIALPNPASEALHARMGFVRAGLYREVGRKLDRWIDIASWELLL